ncbi:hypothetical protein AUR04nite_00280 [Glutamicibacter uratoxydans]|uniref:Uncharacterized protein n=1 Tax=Glutamicibacter uratoxydans TaxID=43667 RepID=A0A4Y4DHG2_GLUUR|nr:hypothetical protein [Glutamicibacter uratoxydans]GED04496.1 hypothetical protein AUR04nite_00280 [Glutamicibacter uratoxydans]
MTTKIEDLRAAQVVEAVRKLAEERPDFVYADQPERVAFREAHPGMKECSYLGAYVPSEIDPTFASYEGEGCIVGQALARLGVSRDDLVEVEGESAKYVMVGNSMPLTYEPGWLSVVQSEQDEGRSWAEAVARGDEAYLSKPPALEGN